MTVPAPIPDNAPSTQPEALFVLTPYYSDQSATVYAGDCLDVLAGLPACSVDAVVTDPPYGLEFMGKDWDKFKTGRGEQYSRGGDLNLGDIAAQSGKGGAGPVYVTRPAKRCANCGKQAWSGSPCKCTEPVWQLDNSPLHSFQQWCQLWAAECLRVLKPGGHLLAFGGMRTHHRLFCAVEDAGFEMRDAITWHFGSGFPKSLNVSAALDRLVPADARCVCDRRSTQTVPDSQGGYPSSHGSDDGQPQSEAGNGPTSPPSPADARARSHVGQLVDGQGAARASTYPDEANAHPSSGSSQRPASPLREVAPPSAFAQSDTQTSTSASPALALRKTAAHIPHTDGSAFDSARYQHMACAVCGGIDIWQGLGTALKPATEIICVARKPLTGTVAANVLAYGTGALNIDAARIDGEPWKAHRATGLGSVKFFTEGDTPEIDKAPHAAGRWPANVVLDHDQAAALDQMSGGLASHGGGLGQHASGEVASFGGGRVSETTSYTDLGGASRFFYTAKADSGERITYTKPGAGSELFGDKGSIRKRCTKCGKQQVNVGNSACSCAEPDFQQDPGMQGKVSHPTVKPLDLMRWLVRLVTPPGGLILDPFAGSGTTVEAAILEGFRCVAIEREPDYLPLITQRINRRRDPVKYLAAAGEDLGLFGLDMIGGGL